MLGLYNVSKKIFIELPKIDLPHVWIMNNSVFGEFDDDMIVTNQAVIL